MVPKFIVDSNVGKLARWLRMMGYDAVFFDEIDDGRMVKTALSQNRTIITKDSEFMKRRAIISGRVKSILVKGDDPEVQMQTVIHSLDLNVSYKPFTRCLECNTLLVEEAENDVKGRVPPFVERTFHRFHHCPGCGRDYWEGSHFQAMLGEVKELEARMKKT